MYVQALHTGMMPMMSVDIRSTGIGVRDGSEPPCRCWEVNLGPLKEQHVLLTTQPSP